MTDQLYLRDAYLKTMDATVQEIRDGAVVSREITRGGLMPLLRDVFLIDLPDDTSFPIIDGPVERALA